MDSRQLKMTDDRLQ